MAHPLDKDDLDQINNSLKGISAAKEILARAKIAETPNVDEQLAELELAEDRLKKFKLGFFPSGRA